MSTITAYPDTERGYVRVETNWSDVAGADFVGVNRVDAITGTETPLRPYVCYDGWCLATVCGRATFWDTEVPLDRSVFYRAYRCPDLLAPTPCGVLDSFTRVVVDSWGSTDTDQPYSLSGVPDANFDVNGSQGEILITAANTGGIALVDTGHTDIDGTIHFEVPALASGGSYFAYLFGRAQDPSNAYYARIEFATSGQATLRLARFVGGASTFIGDSVALGAYAVGQRWAIRLDLISTQIRGKAWNITDPQPIDWQATATDSTFTTGTLAGPRFFAGGGNTNVPFTGRFDNLSVCDPCAVPQPFTIETSPITIASNSRFFLRDPVRPCNDIRVGLCDEFVAPEEGCGNEGVTFSEMDIEQYPPNSFQVAPTNRKNTLAISRVRRGVTSNLVLIAHTFTARNQLLQILAPGSPLLWQGPPEYGIPDRYMDIGQVTVARGLPDHRQQTRVFNLPHSEQDRPAGPSQGVCGTRVRDLCDIYQTWGQAAAANLTWDDLLRDAASDPDLTAGWRTWNGVNTEFADFDDVNTVGRTWTGVLEGD